jgi:hypothetical protein
MGSNATNATKRNTRTSRSGQHRGEEVGRPKERSDAERGMAATHRKQEGQRKRSPQGKG